MLPHGADALGSVKNARLIEVVERGHPGPRRWLGILERRAVERLDGIFGERGRDRALAGAMLLGDRRGLTAADGRTLRDAGLSHLVAISGLHVGLVVWMLHGALRRAGARERFALVGALTLLAPFVAVVGARTSVLRAALAVSLVILGRGSGREGDGLNTLAVVAAVLVVVDPAAPASVSFQLTFLATLGILVVVRDGPDANPVATSTIVSLAAYVATAPAVAWHFGRVAPIAVLSNLPAVPVCAVFLGSGYLAALTTGWPVVGVTTAWIATGCASILWTIADFGSGLPNAAWAVSRPTPVCLVVVYGLLTARSTTRPGTMRMLVEAGIGIAMIWLHVGGPPPAAPERFEATVLDVGQGQAVSLRGTGGGVVLSDSGGSAHPRYDPGERTVVPFLLERVGRYVDALQLSHGHADHADGAFAVLREIEVGELWLGPGAHRDARLRSLSDLAHARGSAIVLVERGTVREVGGIRLEVLAPSRFDGRGSANERSVVIRAGAPPARILIPGDIGAVEERALVDAGADLEAEALVVSHHGSRNGTTERFLEAVAPRWALISAGRRNPFGHPAPEVLVRLDRAGTAIVRTDVHGTTSLTSSSRGWRRLLDGDRRRHEREREQDEENRRHREAAGAETGLLVGESRMAVAHPQQDREPQHVRRDLSLADRLVGDHAEETDDRGIGGDAVPTPADRVHRVPAVQLSDREEIE
jgi:competence protein ComEC